jgi:hypothetical protein
MKPPDCLFLLLNSFALFQHYLEAVEFFKLGNVKSALKTLHKLVEAKDVAKIVIESMVENGFIDDAALDLFLHDALPRQANPFVFFPLRLPSHRYSPPRSHCLLSLPMSRMRYTHCCSKKRWTPKTLTCLNPSRSSA